ncbi:POC1 centriolar protein A [Tulasnella sp. JGI-2019a]|nr:POC1 centriolar protein A [Tulasnella sp. JGI-2019a]
MPSNVSSFAAPSPRVTPGTFLLLILANLYRIIARILTPVMALAAPLAKLPKLDDLTLTLLRDFQRFVLEFMELITASSTHIYHSALAFTPTQTDLFRVYGHMAGGGPKIIRGRKEQWPQSLRTETKHCTAFNHLLVPPGGKAVASGSDDCATRRWDTGKGAPTGEVLEGHTHAVSCLAISPDRKTIASGSYDKTVRLWDACTGAPVGEALTGHTSVVRCLAISPDGKIIVSGADDGTVRLWNAINISPIGKAIEIPNPTNRIAFISFSPDGAFFLVAHTNDSHSFDLTAWDATRQVRKIDTDLSLAMPILNPPVHSFTLNDNGWVLSLERKRLFWLPNELRGSGKLHTLSNVLFGVESKEVSLFDISACISSDVTSCFP